LKDPKTDKERFRKKLLSKKFDTEKKKVISEINALADKKIPFVQTAARLRTKVKLSDTFKVGDYVKEIGKKGRTLYAFSSSEGFRKQCLALKPGESSKVIETADGIYLFTPVVKNFNIVENIVEKEQKTLTASLARNNERLFNQNILMKELERSNVVRNVNFKEEKQAVKAVPTVKRSK
jgi:hypothetical protein